MEVLFFLWSCNHDFISIILYLPIWNFTITKKAPWKNFNTVWPIKVLWDVKWTFLGFVLRFVNVVLAWYLCDRYCTFVRWLVFIKIVFWHKAERIQLWSDHRILSVLNSSTIVYLLPLMSITLKTHYSWRPF